MDRDERRSAASPPGEAAGDSSGTSLESFVAQLHDEGVEAGRREAEQLVSEARAEAKEILRRAEAEADSLLTEARSRVDSERARGRADLELAARDAVLRLQATLSGVLRSILTRAAEVRLSDPDVVSSLLGDVVRAYAQADATGAPTEIHVPSGLGDALEAWWVRELAAGIAGDGEPPRLSPTLEDAGFEYRVGGGTVEVSVESVVETLMQLVRPGLRELLAEATAREPAGSGKDGQSPAQGSRRRRT